MSRSVNVRSHSHTQQTQRYATWCGWKARTREKHPISYSNGNGLMEYKHKLSVSNTPVSVLLLSKSAKATFGLLESAECRPEGLSVAVVGFCPSTSLCLSCGGPRSIYLLKTTI